VRFELTILGCSSAIPAFGRGLTSHLLNVRERLFLVDCGEGTQHRLINYRISYNKIEKIFISHLHGDHVYGLPGLINTMNLTSRRKPLTVYGPPGIRAMLEFLFEISERREFHFELDIIELPVDKHIKVFQDDEVRIYSFPLVHSISTIGYRIEERFPLKNIRQEAVAGYGLDYEQIRKAKKGEDIITGDGKVIKNEYITYPVRKPRSYAFCSDTRYSESYIPYIKDVDLLYHEATYSADFEEKAYERFHSTTKDAARAAKRAGAVKLIIGHFSSRYRDLTPLLQEAREVFPNTLLAEEGKTFEVKRHGDGEQN